jgi:GNAT superfamily N-acetyltransferase
VPTNRDNAPRPQPIIRPATPAEIIPLRIAILRPGQPPAACQYPGDHAPDARHAGAFTPDGRCVGAASIFREPDSDGQDAYRLRGMAVDPDYRGAGVGRALLQMLVAQAAAAGVRPLWCNARLPAVGFYARLGWHAVGDPFDIPEAGGTHYRMRLRADAPQ